MRQSKILSLVSALKVSVNTYAVNPAVMREDKLTALGQMLVTVSPFSPAWNEVSNAIARVPDEESESQKAWPTHEKKTSTKPD